MVPWVECRHEGDLVPCDTRRASSLSAVHVERNSSRKSLGVSKHDLARIDKQTGGRTLRAIRGPGVNRRELGGGLILCDPWFEEHVGQWDEENNIFNSIAQEFILQTTYTYL